MKTIHAECYCCPVTGEALKLASSKREADEIREGNFKNPDEECFPILDGIPDFTWPKVLAEADAKTKSSYEEIADDYERFAPIPFETFRTSETEVRQRMTDQLGINSGDCVLEIGCGAGHGSLHIADRLDSQGLLFLQELSPKLLQLAKRKLDVFEVPIEYSLGNASYLPFKDNFFDAAHHFGGINTFADIRRCLSELSRVVRPGGKVVFGDEGLAPWLRDTKMGRIMTNSNPLMNCAPPLESLPPLAGNVRLEWIMMGAFWVLEFEVADKVPEPDYHIQIPSARGGTHWTRYYGNLEGVTDQTKQIAHRAREKSGMSMHDWLDRVVREAANRELRD